MGKNKNIKYHVEKLGFVAEDRVTGFKGIIESVTFDLYGCIQYWLKPRVNEKGENVEGRWFDVTRLVVINEDRVMPIPDYDLGYVAEGKKGPAMKTSPERNG